MRIHQNCPTCTCTERVREQVNDDRLREIARAYEVVGIDGVARIFNRSRSQSYRLVAQARAAGFVSDHDDA